MSTAESLTGGGLAATLTSVPGASSSYLGGVVAYATDVKISVLGVSTSLVEEHGVVSAPCALAMARGVRELTGSTYGISTTGVAGPAQQEGKPVGTVYVGICGPRDDGHVLTLHLDGDRGTVVKHALDEALVALLRMIAADFPEGTARSKAQAKPDLIVVHPQEEPPFR